MNVRANGLRIGALAAGLGLAIGVAMPASADHFSDTDAFGEAVVECAAIYGAADCIEELFENEGLQEEEGETVVTDPTPNNPNDSSANTEEFVDDVVFSYEMEED